MSDPVSDETTVEETTAAEPVEAATSPAPAKGYAIIETGGKQYRVSVGDRLSVERLPDESGSEISFDRVLLVGGTGTTTIGTPAPLAYLTDYAETLWPQLADLRWTHGWNSRLAITKDHWPHLHEPAPGVLAYLGCNGRGVALGTAIAGQLARRLIDGSAARLDLPVVEPKAIRFHALWPLGVWSVVQHGRILDRLGL